MPLFMFLSGAIAAYSRKPLNFDFLFRKFKSLVVPYMAWAVMSYVLLKYLALGVLSYMLVDSYNKASFFTHVKQIIIYPDYGLWFLWVLFLNFCTLAVIKYIHKWVGLYGYLIVWIVIYSIPIRVYGIYLVKWHLPFFVAGYLIFTHRARLNQYRKLVIGFCVLAFPLLVLVLYTGCFLQNLLNISTVFLDI
jgi:fucose 4-O-acetylase-like acetyltransferase